VKIVGKISICAQIFFDVMLISCQTLYKWTNILEIFVKSRKHNVNTQSLVIVGVRFFFKWQKNTLLLNVEWNLNYHKINWTHYLLNYWTHKLLNFSEFNKYIVIKCGMKLKLSLKFKFEVTLHSNENAF
jgi:hypothetical protein